jgi:hypothetical protein
MGSASMGAATLWTAENAAHAGQRVVHFVASMGPQLTGLRKWYAFSIPCGEGRG